MDTVTECCTPEMALTEVAQLMVTYDCGEIPVDYSLAKKKILGIVADRDTVVRSIAYGINPLTMSVEECMIYPAIMVKDTTSFK